MGGEVGMRREGTGAVPASAVSTAPVSAVAAHVSTSTAPASGPFVRREGGFTTVGVAVALLLVFSLLSVSLHAYWTGTRSGNVQYVADAGALAADEAVAQFVTAGQVVDAVLLSMSLLSVTVYAVSAVAAFIPGAQEVAAELVRVGSQVVKARQKFYESASKGLDTAQKALPALCAVKAAQCVEANARASGLDYKGIAVTMPADGVQVSLADAGEVEEAGREIEQADEEIASKTREDEQARKELSDAKERGWRADCGGDGADMQERAGKLAGLSGAQNPSAASPESWSFSMGLERVRSYYAARLSQEPAEAASGTPEEVAESVARKRFYRYALETVSQGSVPTDAQGNEYPDLKGLARNTEQIRATVLYTEAVYPTSVEGEKRVLHAWTGCPEYAKGQPGGLAAVSGIDDGSLATCPQCKMRPLTLGRVPSPSTSIGNGFEYYYKELVEAAEAYRNAQEQHAQLGGELQELGQGVKGSIERALSSVAGARYDPQPPGRYGCICIVTASEASVPFLGSFSAGGDSLGTRIAISAATLAPDAATDAGSVITDVAAGMLPAESAGGALLGTVMGGWGKLLEVYTKGNDGMVEAFNTVLGGIPVVGDSLSGWAADTFRDAIKAAGLEPADLSTYRPVLVNSSHVLARADGRLAGALAKMKQAAETAGKVQAEGFSVLLDELEQMPDTGECLDAEGFSIAQMPLDVLGLGGAAEKLVLSAPTNLQQAYQQALGQMRSALGRRYGKCVPHRLPRKWRRRKPGERIWDELCKVPQQVSGLLSGCIRAMPHLPRRRLRRGLRRARADECGQMSVEMAVSLPVLVICMVIAIDVLVYMGECARFDHLAPQEVLACATSPSHGAASQANAQGVQDALCSEFSRYNAQVEVDAQEGGMLDGSVVYTCTLSLAPWPLGAAGSSVLGTGIPLFLRHSCSFAVDPYVPGQL